MRKPTPEEMLKAMEDPRFGEMMRAFVEGDDTKVRAIQDQIDREVREDEGRTVQ